jgi:hypothetical protein
MDERRIAHECPGVPFSPTQARLRMLTRLVFPTIACPESAPSSTEEPDVRRVRLRFQQCLTFVPDEEAH